VTGQRTCDSQVKVGDSVVGIGWEWDSDSGRGVGTGTVTVRRHVDGINYGDGDITVYHVIL